MLDDGGIQYLIERAELNVASGNYREALCEYDQIISAAGPNPFFYQRRAHISSRLNNWENAIADLERSIELCPDDAGNYLGLGVYMTLKLFTSGVDRLAHHNDLLLDVIHLYKECLKRDPTNESSWLNTIETYLFMRRWDDALSVYGECRPYINDTEHRLTRSWLGCLALALAGDEILPEDSAPLHEHRIRLPANFHDTSQVDCTLLDLKRDQYDPVRLARAQEIHQRFLGHFDSSTPREASRLVN